MTAQVPVQSDGYGDIEVPLDRVRFTPSSPLGNAQLDALKIAELGAEYAAAGGEKAAMAHLLADLQSIVMKSLLEALPRIMGDFKNVQRNRLNRLAQQVRNLPDLTPPPGFMASMMRGTMPLGLVSREDVIRILTSAMEETPPVS